MLDPGAGGGLRFLLPGLASYPICCWVEESSLCFWSEGDHGGGSLGWDMCSPEVLLPAVMRGLDLLALRVVLGPLSTPGGPAAVLSGLSPSPCPGDWGVFANSLPPSSCLRIRPSALALARLCPCCPYRQGRWVGLSPVEPSHWVLADALCHPLTVILCTAYLSATSLPP